ncbi:MAG: methyltransferase domain-containing protein [Chloroflexi bacterium]|nr:methyltransferase domain-containing protein [Chloroflexota bacterium]
MSDIKAQTRARFGQYAQNYVTGATLAQSDDLERLLHVTQPQPGWRMLDIATGGGHTALKFAPHVAHVVASDLTPAMLDAARAFVAPRSAANIHFCGADAEKLPCAAASFDLVTCRFAAHHFPDVYRFAVEAARVLKPGGTLAIIDHLLPEDERAGDYIDAFDRLRDPTHVRAYSESQWRGLFLDVGLSVEHVEAPRRRAGMLAWAERQGCAPEVVERLHIMLAQAPSAVAAWIQPACAGTPDAAFDHVFILITGKK